MPELPEVETLRLRLEPQLVGQKVKNITIYNGSLRYKIAEKDFAACLDRTVLSVRRRSKYLLLDLSDGVLVVLHLGMSGRLCLQVGYGERHKHDHVLFGFSEKSLWFRDPRRFGLVLCFQSQEDEGYRKLFEHLGVEPLSLGDFTPEYLYEKTRKSSKSVKDFLMDARYVVGVGNIYSSEALYRAGVHPEKSSCRLTFEESGRLVGAIQETLKEAIVSGGTSMRDFAHLAEGEQGWFQLKLGVYGRESQPCRFCGGAIQKIRQAGRSTYFCGVCQH
jgi:formamidopyrimidine-DNA glycosylase